MPHGRNQKYGTDKYEAYRLSFETAQMRRYDIAPEGGAEAMCHCCQKSTTFWQ
jgi:hypothetical protein